MSKRSRRLERSGEPSLPALTPVALPRAQERVRQALLGLGRAGLLDAPSPYTGAVYPWVRRRPEPEVTRLRRHARRLRPPSADRLSRPRSLSYYMGMLSYQFPRRVQVCVRRRIRRSVMFALDKAGRRGLGRGRRWRRTEESNYSC